MTDLLLQVEGVHAGYGDLPVLKGVDLTVHTGDVVAVVGANGAGKTTLLRAITGLLPLSQGRVALGGQDLSTVPANRRPSLGMAMVPENRRLFPFLSVSENLRLGAYHKVARARYSETLDEVYDLFPRLHDRQEQRAGSLSGGEQQMCAIARGLMARPKLLMFDEPSLGLAPIIVEQVFELLETLIDRGLTVLLVEQNVAEAVRLSTRVNVMEQGKITLEGTGEEFLQNAELRAAYLGPA